MGLSIEDRFRAARDALNDSDSGPFLALMDSEVMWWETGVDTPLIGLAAVTARFAELARFGVYDEVHDVFANAEHLVALIHAEADGEGGRLSYSTAEVYHFADSGLIAKRQAFAHDTRGIAEFFGQRL